MNGKEKNGQKEVPCREAGDFFYGNAQMTISRNAHRWFCQERLAFI